MGNKMSRLTDLQLLDQSIEQAREDYHAAESYADELHFLRACNRLQRLRYRVTGSFLPAKNKLMNLYDVGMGYWTSWKAASLAPLVSLLLAVHYVPKAHHPSMGTVYGVLDKSYEFHMWRIEEILRLLGL